MTCLQDCLREAELEALCDRKDARIAELEAAISKALKKASAKGMGDWPEFQVLRKVMMK